MRRVTWWLAMGMLLAGSGCSVTTSEQPPTSTPLFTGATSFTDLGRVLGPTDFGQPAGTIVGDPTGVLLPDGRIRLFVYVENRGVWRALSADATGTRFQVEGPCQLIPDAGTNTMGTPWGEPRVVPISGGLRMFYMQDGGIASATSTDHIVWRQEPGLRITPQQAGFSATTTGSVVTLAGGGYRIYFSSLRSSPTGPATAMKSATSTDMLNWIVDSGVRVGPGAAFVDQNATDPFAMRNPDGSVTAWYFVQPASGSAFQGTPGLYVASATDGLAFRTSSFTGIPGGNPDVIVRADGVRLMFLTASDQAGGPGVRVVRLN